MTQERAEAQLGQNNANQLDLKLMTDVDASKTSMGAKHYGIILHTRGDGGRAVPEMAQTKSGSFEVSRLDAKPSDAKPAKPADATKVADQPKSKETDIYITHKEKLNGTDVYTNSKGEVVGIHKMDRNGKDEFWRRGKDGKWTFDANGKTVKMDEISDVTVDKGGNIHYRVDKHKISVVENNKQQRVTSDDSGASVFLETEGNHTRPVATTDGKGHGRKFHYDKDNKVDQIDGHLGHWERRTNAKGETEWVNNKNKAVWKGEFEVKSNGDLIFKGQNGVTWKFTKEGKDELQRRKSA